MFPLWFSNSNSNSFCNAGIQALTRPHQLEHVSSPLPSAVRIFVSFDLTSRWSDFITFSRIFQMSHQLKYFPLVRQWLGLPQRLQWEHAATTSPWQVLSFAPVNNTSPLLLIKDLESNGPFCWSDQIISFPESLPHQVRLAPTPRLFVAPTLDITVSSNLSSNTVNNIRSQIFTIWSV